MLGPQSSASVRSIPTRHGCDLTRARIATEGLRSTLARTPSPDPSAQQWQALGEALLRGDEPMDRLLDWMFARGYREVRPLWDTAVSRGIDAVPDAPSVLRQFFERVETPPAWVDYDRLDEGARCVAIAGRIGNHVLRDLALVGGYRLSAVNKTLVATGALQKGPARRLIETTKWWIDCTRVGGMARHAPGYVSTLQVRMIHALVRRKLLRQPEWDVETDGLPINQEDMHITYLGFSTVYILGQQLLGVPLTHKERQAIMDLWRYVTWLIGIEEQWLHTTDIEARTALYQSSLAQAGPDETSRLLAGALVDEPLQLLQGPFRGIRGRFGRAMHLSIIRTFIGKSGMRDLGLPSSSLWYPMLTVLPRFLFHITLRALPGGRAFLIRRGFADQEKELLRRTGGAELMSEPMRS